MIVGIGRRLVGGSSPKECFLLILRRPHPTKIVREGKSGIGLRDRCLRPETEYLLLEILIGTNDQEAAVGQRLWRFGVFEDKPCLATERRDREDAPRRAIDTVVENLGAVTRPRQCPDKSLGFVMRQYRPVARLRRCHG